VSEVDSTRPVPDSDDGSYLRPPSVQQQIAEKLRRLPRVNHDGHELLPATADPTVAPIVDPAAPAARPAMQPNPLQGIAGGATVPAPARGGTLEHLAAQLADGDAPLIPDAYTPAPPR